MAASSSSPSGTSGPASLKDRGPAPVAFEDVAVLHDDVLMLDGASGHVPPGGVLALRGANGSGKTTLLRVLAGMIAPTAGRVQIAGRVPDDRDRRFRRTLAALIGPPITARDLTVAEHLRFIGATWGSPASAAASLADDLLEELAISALARRYPHELSSGQSQLVAIALTLARPLDVLLLDEPEQRLDPDRLDLVIEALQRRVDHGSALVIATHSPHLAGALATDTLTLVGEDGDGGGEPEAATETTGTETATGPGERA
ncbi:multidrug ABC transporter ATP-binding protein [Brachybacterium endophyticum]|uniref:Multidrug ABC transporter ATP-binding protein n=1 Tax=Brachybacterium endophyticum TaxID=2182385 RepID=A0A2U2RLC8_9MICO|nr:ATP-binding cassette domain-containing protein [Brachybacterium endophyticum]PWH06677.1 multidrug ABC transporter ATP-binding protein [Brachybacterium endophyticum]